MPTATSPTLLAANRRLHKLRAQVQARRQAAGLPVSRPPSSCETTAAPAPLTTAECITRLPPHLGWESEAATRAVRAALARQQERQAMALPQDSPADDAIGRGAALLKMPVPKIEEKATGQISAVDDQKHGQIRIYPTLSIAAKEAGMAAVERLWHLLRYLDNNGRGWVLVEEARARLTDKESELRICGWRQLRNLLRAGEGRFWHRTNKHQIFLRSPSRVALALDVERLVGRPVYLPLHAFTGGMGGYNATIYAAWHSGRNNDAPISRQTLATATQTPPRTQRHYEAVASLKRQTNYAVGRPYTKEVAQETAWQRGRGTFKFCDKKGQQGKPGRDYIAWRLPNSYEKPFTTQPRSTRQRAINREIDLRNKGARGTVSQIERIFHENGGGAGRSYNRNGGRLDAYWRYKKSGSGQIWLCIAQAEKHRRP